MFRNYLTCKDNFKILKLRKCPLMVKITKMSLNLKILEMMLFQFKPTYNLTVLISRYFVFFFLFCLDSSFYAFFFLSYFQINLSLCNLKLRCLHMHYLDYQCHEAITQHVMCTSSVRRFIDICVGIT